MRYRKTEDAIALLSGALLGAAAMYLLDPALGRRRRKYVAGQTGEYLHGAGDMLQGGWNKLSDSARDIGATVADQAQGYGRRVSDAAGNYGRRLTAAAADAGTSWISSGRDYREKTADLANNVTDYGNRLWNQVRHVGQRLSHRASDAAGDAADATGSRRTSAASVTATALGCCVVGAGLMYLMDPRIGRARRAWLGDRITSLFRRGGRSFYRAGRHWANRAYGAAAETRGRFGPGEPLSSEQLLNRVRSEMGRAVSHPRLIEVMTDANGTVTLSGCILQSEAGRLISTIESVPGVRLVVNRLELKETEEELTRAAGSQAQGAYQL